jgi:hypothetical protein
MIKKAMHSKVKKLLVNYLIKNKLLWIHLNKKMYKIKVVLVLKKILKVKLQENNNLNNNQINLYMMI